MTRSMTVLVIDDSPDIHALLRVRLAAERVDLIHAMTAEEGLMLARTRLPDLVLLDIQMPDRSGLSLCQALMHDTATLHIPVIFLTGECDVEIKVRAFDVGAMDYVTKPFDTAELRARVRAALRMKRYQDMLATRAQIDALTGLYNRAYFDARIDALVGARAESGHVGLVMVDIDHFKSINDRYGHPFGDQVLRRVAEHLATTAADARGVACRYGGEEMALVLPDVDAADAAEIAERARGGIRGLDFRSGATRVTVTASFGVSDVAALRVRCSSELLAAADAALYESKRGGRDRVSRARRLELAA